MAATPSPSLACGAVARIVVSPPIGAPPDSGPTTLRVEDNTTGDPSGLHGATVDIFGRGFLAREVISVWITAPDGTVLDYPQQQTSDVGSFESTFLFTEQNPVGHYAVTALGTRSGYQVIADFNLGPAPRRRLAGHSCVSPALLAVSARRSRCRANGLMPSSA